MSVTQFHCRAIAAALLGFALFASPLHAQVPGRTSPPPGAVETATEAAVDAVKPRARRAAPRKTAARKASPRNSAKKVRAARGEAVPRNGAIAVTNRRDANLLELTATPQNGGAPIVIARDVAAGARATGKLPPKSGCVFSLSGTFDDESSMEAANMNLCKDGRINLVE